MQRWLKAARTCLNDCRRETAMWYLCIEDVMVICLIINCGNGLGIYLGLQLFFMIDVEVEGFDCVDYEMVGNIYLQIIMIMTWVE